MISRWRTIVAELKKKTLVLYYAFRDPRTPLLTKALLFFVVAHTFSPIDLIPDFIPVLGYLDDLVITPLGLYIAYKLIPYEVLIEAQQKVEQSPADLSRIGRVGAILIILTWLLALVVASVWLLNIYED
ncbi:MAG: DUF1232 domain-containing protein [Anaerolineales bacterium]|nr:DUF1232 domain-containing protein [Anaerolineales bacterium]